MENIKQQETVKKCFRSDVCKEHAAECDYLKGEDTCSYIPQNTTVCQYDED